MAANSLEARKINSQSVFSAREAGEDKVIEGYFIVYGQKTELWDGWTEEIAQGACTKSLSDNDIRCLYNHNHDFILGRMSAKTMTLTEDSHGVKGVITVNQNDRAAMDVYERVKRGDITGCSFGFWPVVEEYHDEKNGDTHVIVKEADVLEISVCPFPAYEQTYIDARKRSVEEAHHEKLTAKKAALKARLEKCHLQS